jgi:hypothetical protein
MGKPALPSLAQIQAKMSTRGHRRGVSVGAVPQPRAPKSVRTDSQDSMEVLITPTEEYENTLTRREPRIVLPSGNTGNNCSQTATPPSPTGMKSSRLAPFLRQRISGRLATRPVSMPPLQGRPLLGPKLNIIPPTLVTPLAKVPPPVEPCTPIRASFPFPTLSTPPTRSTSPLHSPTSSTHSQPSPSLSVPMITCTPAPQRVRRNGVEEDSDEEEGDVVVFSAAEEDEVNSDKEERERRGRIMRAKLGLRRLSD